MSACKNIKGELDDAKQENNRLNELLKETDKISSMIEKLGNDRDENLKTIDSLIKEKESLILILKERENEVIISVY